MCMACNHVQALFMTVPFRQRVYEWKYDPDLHGSREECIPLQLQRLFTSLQHSRRMAVDTTALTTSFGWAAADACRQQDVTELMNVLFHALDKCVSWVKRRGNVDTLT